jgi:PilZ domain-containing protein
MGEIRDRRRVARLTVPRHLTGLGLELRLVRLLDLSAQGARIEHPEHLHEGLVCYVDLPPALGRLRLTGQVVWTRLHKGEQTYEGESRVYYQSGLAFVGLTPEQQRKLAVALEILKTSGPEDSGHAALDERKDW